MIYDFITLSDEKIEDGGMIFEDHMRDLILFVYI